MQKSIKQYIVFPILLLISSSILANTKFVFATHTDPPLSDKIIAVYQEAFDRMGHTVEFINLPGRRIVQFTNDDVIDGDASRIKDFQRITGGNTGNYLIVDEPIYTIELVVITKKDVDFTVVDWKAVNTGKVAYVSGSMHIENNVATHNREALPEASMALEMVKRGRVQSAVLFKTVATELFKKNKEYDNYIENFTRNEARWDI
jgi:polar amino acid transport system substrate-binding protein